MGKNVLVVVCVVVVGALFGSFFGHFISTVFPDGTIHRLFANEISAGLQPTRLDLRVIELTFGCMMHFNMASVLGIVASALLFKIIFK